MSVRQNATYTYHYVTVPPCYSWHCWAHKYVHAIREV